VKRTDLSVRVRPAMRAVGGLLLCAAGLPLWCAPAWGHVHSVQREQLPGRLGSLELRVPHGCGDSPTIRIDVEIPEGLTDVEPLPHEGWRAETRPVETGRVTAVSWAGGRLPSDAETSFTFRARFPNEPGKRLWFKAVQICEQGSTRWVEVPRPGESVGDLPHPAAWVDLVAPGTSQAERAVNEGSVVPFLSMGGMVVLAVVVLLLVRPGKRRT
jgi:hypothetical protein